MDLQFTAVFRQVPEGYIGFVEELPGANTQGATLEEARANLQEAVAMVLDANRELAQQTAGKGPVIREPLRTSTVPRHTEINDDLARKICKDLGIPQP
jgi:predicted RNase H-like HicB family nuclease